MISKTQQAEELTAAQSTEQLLAAFTITDTLMSEGLTREDYLAVATSRGFIMGELAKRGELGLLDPAFA